MLQDEVEDAVEAGFRALETAKAEKIDNESKQNFSKVDIAVAGSSTASTEMDDSFSDSDVDLNDLFMQTTSKKIRKN